MADISKATPRPWKVYGAGNYTWPGIEAGQSSIAIIGEGEDGCGIKGRTKEEAQANAALIVKAVNERDELIEALRRLAIDGRVWMAQGGRTVPCGYSCRVCGADWGNTFDDAPEEPTTEAHKSHCIIARAESSDV